MLCDDGHLYVVKPTCSSQGPNVLANEILGNLLAREFGLPVPVDSIVSVATDVLKEAGPPAWFKLDGSGYVVPAGGDFYGSRFVGEPEGAKRTIQYIGSSEIARLSNREDFLGMLILDVWANHQDVRQAVYSQIVPGRSLYATFIDHGQMFGGARCKWTEKSYCFYYHMDVYKDLWNEEAVGFWTSRFRARAKFVLANYLDGIPRGWYDCNHKDAAAVLLNRLNHLDELLVPYRDRLKR